MILTIIQADLVWENKTKNLERLGRMISSVPRRTGMVILPEMFNTGFTMKAASFGEAPDGLTFEWMKSVSGSLGIAVCGSYIIKRKHQFFNTFVFVSPDGEIHSYDKRHLFSPGTENKIFTRGRDRVVFSYMGFRICPNICYDLRFPVWSRNLNDYDLLVNCANWPESRRDVWSTLLKARAIENQCYVAGANRIGTDGEGISYAGDSTVTGPKGEIIASCEPAAEALLTAEISKPELDRFREKFPVWRDSDEFRLVI